MTEHVHNEYCYNKILLVLSFRNNLIGTKYLLDALLLNAKRSQGQTLSADVYPAIANKYNTNACSIEKAIRKTISDCYYFGKLSLLNKIAHADVIDAKYPPTNSELLSLINTVVELATGEEKFEQLLKCTIDFGK